MIFLTNPRERTEPVAKKRLPPRHKSGPNKGRFRKRASAKRNPKPRGKGQSTGARPAARRAPRPRAAPARAPARRTRSNPRRVGVVKKLTGGVYGALGVLVGKAGARTVPVLANLPKEGPLGLGVQAATAIVLGMIADRFLGKRLGEFVLVGALTAPLETLAVAYRIPFLAPALSPTTGAAELGAYYGYPLGAYVTREGAPALGAYVEPDLMPDVGAGVGAYVQQGQ